MPLRNIEMKIAAIIPARWASTRFKGKILAKIAGKPMIQHVWEKVRKSKALSDIVIACDEKKVLKVCQDFGAWAVLTSKKHPSGTDRIAQAAKIVDADVIINVQGDEPLIHHSVIDQLAAVFKKNKDLNMATVIKLLEKKEDIDNPNVVKVVIDRNGFALYFSRSPIPFNRDKEKVNYYKHFGIYGYRKDFLFAFRNLPVSKLEKAEKLEQLRVLEAGYKIKTVQTDIETVGVDTKEDLLKVESLLRL